MAPVLFQPTIRGGPEMFDDDDALKEADDIESGDEEGTPVHAPTIPEDEGNVGDGTGEGDAGDANQVSPSGGTV